MVKKYLVTYHRLEFGAKRFSVDGWGCAVDEDETDVLLFQDAGDALDHHLNKLVALKWLLQLQINLAIRLIITWTNIITTMTNKLKEKCFQQRALNKKFGKVNKFVKKITN